MKSLMDKIKSMINKPSNNVSIIEKFTLYKKEWLKETAYHSNPNIITDNKNYKEIIKLGKAVIPLILEDIRKKNTIFWWDALDRLTDVYIFIPEEHRGNVTEINKIYLEELEKRGFK